LEVNKVNARPLVFAMLGSAMGNTPDQPDPMRDDPVDFGPASSDPDDHDYSSRRRRRDRPRSSLALWGWLVLALLLALLVGLVAMDLHHRDRYELTCRDNRVTLRRGRRLPQPFGFEEVGGLFKPLRLLRGSACHEQRSITGREEAEVAYLDVLLHQVGQTLSEPEGGNLTAMREQLRQALHITRSPPHRTRRPRVLELLADLDYREGRAALSQVEAGLRTALVRLREAYRLAGDRYGDVRQWIDHLEQLLRSTAPTPGTPSPPPGLLLPPVAPKTPSPPVLPGTPSDPPDEDSEPGVLM